ncbi:MAG: tetratricopeptide repeat protein [Spirochaetaceae bacterium]|jgi:tetratricopeptide (TPR) repeat protein|nr:tetratricopeptide repeat protein [Spirochaetaceae bacterium]
MCVKKAGWLFLVPVLLLCSCGERGRQVTVKNNNAYLTSILQKRDLDIESRYTAMNTMAGNLFAARDYTRLILFLTDHVEKSPDDEFNAYWLLLTAYAYLETDSSPVAEYYFDRIIKTCGDLQVKGESLHFICLRNLVKISNSPQNRIAYFDELIRRFPDKIRAAELYFHLAREYEKLGEWDMALKTYALFASLPGAADIQIPGISDPYRYARNLITFNESSKNRTFHSLDELAEAVKMALANYNYAALDRYRSGVNFFAMSWKQDENDTNSQRTFYIRTFMMGRTIHFSQELDESSNPNEAYLRTWGWSQQNTAWYFYFRKINFPVDPEIHGKWEWAGIYFGEKL